MTTRSAAAPEPLADRAAIPLRPLALVFRLVSLAGILLGVVRITGIFTPNPTWSALLYYTVLSNLLCLVWVVLLIIRTVRDLRTDGPRGTSTPSARWSAAVMMAISVTMAIYLIVLVPMTFVQGNGYEPFTLTDNLIHIITPCLLILDWLLFVPKGRVRGGDPMRWTLIPIAYLVFALVYGGFGGEFAPGVHYPYPFLDVAALGVAGVASWIVVLAVALIALGYVYLGLDRLLARLVARG
ncbi:Pr6Pr family membrane protein [Leucobacter allii]|uniref:Pr6Pr family membrane protein n=1 Tax=Leucobacter allii TaxID=2932247 RepID=A0ABY4FJ93_9MICO|nr:Pr6Pr family membrane protein [Leucobacter allii]UOQ56754.1 Pr6Pr family membrane protein [Leucobacter allii]